MQKLQLYALGQNGQVKLGLLRNPRHLPDLDCHRPRDLRLLTPPLPSFRAYLLLKKWEARLGGLLAPFWRSLLFLRFNSGLDCGKNPPASDPDAVEAALSAVLKLVRGRLLSEQYLLSALGQQGYWPADISRALDQGVQAGVLLQFPGIQEGAWGQRICTRCNSEVLATQPCLNCGLNDCLICRNCLSGGGNRGCSTFLTAPREKTEKKATSVDLLLPHGLTPAQKGAAEELLTFWQGEQGRALVWAACGAGKTEVTFPLIQKALSGGAQVLFAIPRLDIVREMVRRFQEAFPRVVLAIHHGGRPLLAWGDLVLATTHQVLHFYRRFDLIILDEVDAFPYHGNETLRFGLARALVPGGKLVEMTATPQSLGRAQCLVTIPARFHGHPLPEPQICVCGLPPWVDLPRQPLPSEILDILAEKKHPWLVFAPTIAACNALYQTFRSILTKNVGICHSQEPQRNNTVLRFQEGALDVVVATSVLERGVNFPVLGVLVLYAEHPIFTRSALVQMAGRVGRSQKAPGGTVLFAAKEITPAMRGAVRLIQRLNQEAEKKGLLRHAPLA